MNCPYCNHIETKVLDSRESKDGTTIKRRRTCGKCEKRFTTSEKVLKLDLEVLKSDGEVQEFNLSKIKKSLLKCCDKRPVTLEQIEGVLENVLEDLKKVEITQLKTSDIGKIVLKSLKDVDEIAYLRFAIVHNNYGCMNDFMSELEKLKSFDGLEYKEKKK